MAILLAGGSAWIAGAIIYGLIAGELHGPVLAGTAGVHIVLAVGFLIAAVVAEVD